MGPAELIDPEQGCCAPAEAKHALGQGWGGRQKGPAPTEAKPPVPSTPGRAQLPPCGGPWAAAMGSPPGGAAGGGGAGRPAAGGGGGGGVGRVHV